MSDFSTFVNKILGLAKQFLGDKLPISDVSQIYAMLGPGIGAAAPFLPMVPEIYHIEIDGEEPIAKVLNALWTSDCGKAKIEVLEKLVAFCDLVATQVSGMERDPKSGTVSVTPSIVEAWIEELWGIFRDFFSFIYNQGIDKVKGDFIEDACNIEDLATEEFITECLNLSAKFMEAIMAKKEGREPNFANVPSITTILPQETLDLAFKAAGYVREILSCTNIRLFFGSYLVKLWEKVISYPVVLIIFFVAARPEKDLVFRNEPQPDPEARVEDFKEEIVSVIVYLRNYVLQIIGGAVPGPVEPGNPDDILGKYTVSFRCVGMEEAVVSFPLSIEQSNQGVFVGNGEGDDYSNGQHFTVLVEGIYYPSSNTVAARSTQSFADGRVRIDEFRGAFGADGMPWTRGTQIQKTGCDGEFLLVRLGGGPKPQPTIVDEGIYFYNPTKFIIAEQWKPAEEYTGSSLELLQISSGELIVKEGTIEQGANSKVVSGIEVPIAANGVYRFVRIDTSKPTSPPLFEHKENGNFCLQLLSVDDGIWVLQGGAAPAPVFSKWPDNLWVLRGISTLDAFGLHTRIGGETYATYRNPKQWEIKYDAETYILEGYQGNATKQIRYEHSPFADIPYGQFGSSSVYGDVFIIPYDTESEWGSFHKYEVEGFFGQAKNAAWHDDDQIQVGIWRFNLDADDDNLKEAYITPRGEWVEQFIPPEIQIEYNGNIQVIDAGVKLVIKNSKGEVKVEEDLLVNSGTFTFPLSAMGTDSIGEIGLTIASGKGIIDFSHIKFKVGTSTFFSLLAPITEDSWSDKLYALGAPDNHNAGYNGFYEILSFGSWANHNPTFISMNGEQKAIWRSPNPDEINAAAGWRIGDAVTLSPLWYSDSSTNIWQVYQGESNLMLAKVRSVDPDIGWIDIPSAGIAGKTLFMQSGADASQYTFNLSHIDSAWVQVSNNEEWQKRFRPTKVKIFFTFEKGFIAPAPQLRFELGWGDFSIAGINNTDAGCCFNPESATFDKDAGEECSVELGTATWDANKDFEWFRITRLNIAEYTIKVTGFRFYIEE
jgi:hypothetical protein